MKAFTGTSCIVLCAGSSRRMGQHKALLKFDAHTTFMSRIAGTFLQAGIEQVIVVLNAELHALVKEREADLSEGVELVINDRPEAGRFYSLQTGVKYLKAGNSCFLQNMDNPFTSESLLRRLIKHKAEADVLIPAFQHKTGHPALFSPVVAHEIHHTTDPDVRIDDFLKRFSIKIIATDEANVLTNINSPEEYMGAGFKF